MSLDDRELNRVLKKKERDLTSKALKQRAGKEGLEVMEKIAKSNVAVDTGALRDSIRIEETNDGADLITDSPYAASEEYLGRAYMRPAAQQGERQAIMEAGKEFKKEAEKR